jgi:hypothetical protein
MSIKNRGEKYVEILNFLRREYVKKFGKEAEGLSDTMLKRQAAEQVDEMSKVVPFPEKNITDWTKDRPKTGPKADVKTFPKQKKLTPEPKTSIERLEKELEEMEKLGQPYKDTSVSDFMSDYFDMPQKAPPKKTITELNDVKLYGDETFEELQIIKDTGEHPRDKKANGGRIGYAEGMSDEEVASNKLPPDDFIKQLQELDLKFSPDGIVMEGMQDSTTLDRLQDALKKQERRTPLVEYEDGTIYYPDFDEYYNDDGKQVEGPAFWAKPIPKLFEVPNYSGRKSIDLANGGRIGYSTGKRAKGIKSLMEKLNEKLSKKKNKGKVEIADDAPVSEKTKLQREFDEFNKRFKEKTTGTEPIKMSMNDLIEYRSQNPAGKGRFTRAEAIIARLENTIEDAKNNPDETSDYVLTNFPNMIEELKNKPELANNENVWKELGMTGLPENQRFKLYDDGTVDFETLKPTHQFKLREDIKRKLNAEGGLNYLMGL